MIFEDIPCLFGCPRDDETVREAPDRLYRMPGRFVVVRCRRCGLMRTNPRPTSATIGACYPETYPPHQCARPRGFPSKRRFPGISLHARSLPLSPPGRLLEIGCGAGAFLQKAVAEGWRATGIEPSAPAARRARRNGLEVINAPLDTAPAPVVPYDLVVGWMVLEHLHNPVAALQRLYRWTRPGGKLAVSVPDGRASVFGMFGESEYALQLPVHLYHFTRETVTRLLSKGGWRVEKIRYQRVLTNAVAGMGLKLAAADRLPGIARQLVAVPSSPSAPGIHALLYPAALLAAACGRTGRMTVWAGRK